MKNPKPSIGIFSLCEFGQCFQISCINQLGHASCLNCLNEKSPNLSIETLTLFVNPLAQNSNSLLEDLRRLNQLKDSPHQNDIDIEKNDKSTLINTKKISKVRKLKR